MEICLVRVWIPSNSLAFINSFKHKNIFVYPIGSSSYLILCFWVSMQMQQVVSLKKRKMLSPSLETLDHSSNCYCSIAAGAYRPLVVNTEHCSNVAFGMSVSISMEVKCYVLQLNLLLLFLTQTLHSRKSQS